MPEKPLLLANHSFAEWLVNDPEMMRLREMYSELPAEERRMAAMAFYVDDIPNPFAHLIDPEAQPFNSGDGSVRALAIDPLYAPAILTVGSIEYQLSRSDAAMELFMSLLDLPPQTEDICVIIDKAGEFLLDQEDWPGSARLYEAASTKFPDFAAFHSGLGYCAEKMGKLDDAVEHNRRAVVADPSDAKLLSDLGWSLIRNGEYEEAEATLLRSLAAAPGDQMTRGNLEYLRRIQRGEV